MNKELYISLIIKQLNNEISVEELRNLEEWLKISENNASIKKETVKNWNDLLLYKANYKPNKKLAWEKIESAISKKEVNVISIKRPNSIFKIAATVLILIGFTFFVKNYINNDFIIVKTANNESLEVLLPDNSIIYLNGNSSIKYSKNFTKRDILFKGEAFFEVTKDRNRPFTVEANETFTKVLGTSFNINTNKNIVEVALYTGKVVFSNNTESITLKPNEMATYNPSSNKIHLSKKLENNNSWKTKKIIFDNTKVKSVISNLERVYNVQIKTSKDSDCTFTGSFENKKLDEILEVFSFSLNAKLSKSEGVYYISQIQCN